MSSTGPRRVAAFDFDGTLARRDTLVPFLARAAGPRRFATVFGAEGLGAVRSRLRGGADRRVDRDDLKVGALARIFVGEDPARFETLAEAHAARIERLLRPEMRERVAWHRTEGHELVIVSASLAAYLRPVAERLGIDHVIAVELEVGDDGRLTGRMAGPNVRGEEKAVRLRAWLGDDACEVWAYGDSSGDDALLAMADHPTWVGRRQKRNPTQRP
jgi:phosphatidylglycerophosphatase C